MDALFAHAAALPRVELGEPRRAIGRSTVESMQSGAVFGHAAFVDGMCERHRGRARRVHDHGDGGSRRPGRPALTEDPPLRALAHPPRIAPAVRQEHRSRCRGGEPVTDAPNGEAPDGDAPAVPYRFPGTVGAGVVAADPAYASLEAGGSSGVVVTVAGRIMRSPAPGPDRLRRAARLDRGRSSSSPKRAVTECFEEFTRLNLGDWIGATGEVVRTRRGELSVACRLVVAARRGPPRLRRQVARRPRRRAPLPPARGRPVGERRCARDVPLALEGRRRAAPPPRRARLRRGRDAGAPARSPAGRTPGRSSPTTTRSTPTSTCGSRPSST